MKYPVVTYAKALAGAITGAKGEKDALVKNFLELLRKNGDEAHAKKIVETAAHLVRQKMGIRKVTIESARKLSGAQEAELKQFLKSGDVVEHKVDPELVAGVRIILDDELQFDGSLRGKLEKVFNA